MSDPKQLRTMGFSGIVRESFNIIAQRRSIFRQITLTLIFPLCLSFLFLFPSIFRDPVYLIAIDEPTISKLSDVSSKEWVRFWLLTVGYFTWVIFLSLLSTSAIVYTVACIYAGIETTFMKVMKSVPKVYGKLVVTFIWGYAMVAVFNPVIAGMVLVVYARIMKIDEVVATGVIIIFVIILSTVGSVYITMILKLASVASVLEDVSGLDAMTRIRRLMKGLTESVWVVIFLVDFCLATVILTFEYFAAYGHVGLSIVILTGIVCVLLLVEVMLFSLVLQTVAYFVCKSRHHETIDVTALSVLLEVNYAEFAPFVKSKEVQLQTPPPV